MEGVFKGMSSLVYQTGRFSPKMEKGVHQFQGLLAEFLGERVGLSNQKTSIGKWFLE